MCELLWFRSSRPDVFCDKGALRNFTKFTGRHLCQSIFFNKVAGLRPATSLKKRLWHRCFPVNFDNFLRTPVLQNTSGRLPLYGTEQYLNLRMNSLNRTGSDFCYWCWSFLFFLIIDVSSLQVNVSW